ncbi:MAG TPA: glycosyltransferase family 2 protein [Candidatus Obscuribacterales bacterium]
MTESINADVDFSVVIPVFRCAECLVALHERLTAVLENVGQKYEIVFVNDCSPDEAERILRQISARDPRVIVHTLASNQGQHFAIATGLKISRGKYAVVMDADLEDPPEAVPEFISKATEGFDIVLGARSQRACPLIRRLFTQLFRRIIAPYRTFENRHSYGALSVLSRRAIEQFLRQGDPGRGYLVVLDRLALRHTVIFYRSEKRYAGKSAYTPARLLRTALAVGLSARRSATGDTIRRS